MVMIGGAHKFKYCVIFVKSIKAEDRPAALKLIELVVGVVKCELPGSVEADSNVCNTIYL